jgi:hypothetical protein
METNAFHLTGLLFCFWVIALNPDFVSCVLDAFFPSLKQNVMQMCCFFKSAIKKWWITLNMQNNNFCCEETEGYG